MTKETKDLGAAPPRSLIATTVQIVPTEEQLATWLMCNVLGKQTDPDWIPEQLLWEPIVIALRQFAAAERRAARREARRVALAELVGLAERAEHDTWAWSAFTQAHGNVSRALGDDSGTADASPPPDSSAALLEARRLLGEAVPYMERDALHASAGDPVHDLLDRVWPFLRSDSERSEHGKG